jgi:hypothetical protein
MPATIQRSVEELSIPDLDLVVATVMGGDCEGLGDSLTPRER